MEPHQRDIVFYAESNSYIVYFEPFIQYLIQDHGRTVCYVTSDIDDPFFKKNNVRINKFFIGDCSIRTIFFASLNTNLLVTTLLDLNRFHLKRSQYPVHYVFVPHNMVSTHMAFRKGAHNFFDTIFCVGPHHVKELREAEILYDLKPRTLVENGYVRLDTIYEESKLLKPIVDRHSRPFLRILVAPTWGPTSLLEYGMSRLVRVLLEAGHHVTVRPHRQMRKLAGHSLDMLKETFSCMRNFVLEEESSSHNSFHRSDLLVTDWSGAAFSFSFALERPVLFIDTPKKVNNVEYTSFENKPIEVTIRDQIGFVLSPGDLDQAATIAETLCSNHTQEFVHKIRNLRGQYVFNFTNSAKRGARYLANLADELHDSKIE